MSYVSPTCVRTMSGQTKLSHTRTPCAPFTANWAPTSAPLRIVPKPFSVTYKPTLVLTSSSNGTTSVYTPFKPLSPLFTLPTVLRLSLSLLSLPNSTVTFLALSQSRIFLGFRNSPCSMAIRGVDFKWYDGFFLSMLATSVYPLIVISEDNGLAAGMGL
ncbi:hypothetical protein CK203_006604 [Vitis vinifera]|uniref:Uncharacterized protein n=1 Tax=Vitis vinifera TaxID=29760 RepID=A0A438KBU2_VITVI|nr:hypothetical protein CK203_006604 [Vitis vinifera]